MRPKLGRTLWCVCGQSWWRRIGLSAIGVLGSDELTRFESRTTRIVFVGASF